MNQCNYAIDCCNDMLSKAIENKEAYFEALAKLCLGLFHYSQSEFKPARKNFIESREVFGSIYPESHPWLAKFDKILYPARF